VWELVGIDWGKIPGDVLPWIIVLVLLVPHIFKYLNERAVTREQRRERAAKEESSRHEREVSAVEELSANTLSILAAVNGMSNRLFRSEQRLEEVGAWLERLAIVLALMVGVTVVLVVYRDIKEQIRRRYGNV
jgi:di/tricarboxylate transporter